MSKLFSDIEVLWIARFDYKPDWILSKHEHEGFYQLVYIIDGAGELQIGPETFQFKGPKILFFPPGVEHGFPKISSQGMRTIDTKFRIISEDLQNECNNLSHIIDISSDEFFYHLEEIRTIATKKTLFYQDHANILISLILIKLLKRDQRVIDTKSISSISKNKQQISPISKSIISFFSENYSRQLCAADLEDLTNYSYRYVSKKFFFEMKLTPMKYLERYRIERAKELLSYSDYEQKHICEMVGFIEQHHFSRIFKKVTGEPPGKWRLEAKSAIRKDVIIDPEFSNTLRIQTLGDDQV